MKDVLRALALYLAMLTVGTILALAWVGLVALACIAPLLIQIGMSQHG